LGSLQVARAGFVGSLLRASSKVLATLLVRRKRQILHQLVDGGALEPLVAQQHAGCCDQAGYRERVTAW
jgi:hypothetical protein